VVIFQKIAEIFYKSKMKDGKKNFGQAYFVRVFRKCREVLFYPGTGLFSQMIIAVMNFEQDSSCKVKIFLYI